jgi:exopolysaccharide production protein ExoQ
MRVFGMVIVFLSALIYMESADEALEYLKIIIWVYIPVTIFSILFIHEAIQWEFPAWRGIAKHKNELGQVAVISIIIWSFSAFKAGFKNKTVAVSFLIASVVILVGSKSTTSIFSAGFILMMSIMWSIENKIIRPTIGDFFSSIILIAFYSSLLVGFYFMIEVVSSFLYAIGKDPTITGRVDLWTIVFDQTEDYLIIGCGFGGFWNVNSPISELIYEKLWWLPTTSHMGYLDILNETGLIGFSILMLMIFFYLKKFWKSRDYLLWKSIFITALFLNITESTLFRINEFTGDLAVFCYLAFYVKHIKSLNSFKSA